jgi:hypothetical protein
VIAAFYAADLPDENRSQADASADNATTMTDLFPILEVKLDWRREVEQLGSKPKFWFKLEGTNWLFKEARENTGEDWAEKVASEIAKALGLPTHDTELAVWEGKRGCAVKSFLATDQSVLVHGNELLGGLISGYDKEKQRGQADHTFDNIVRAIETLFASDKDRRVAASRMVGYLVFDALVGNTDRHHQNWGVLLERRQFGDQTPSFVPQLAPTFDHASSLGRELTDGARQRYLHDGTVEHYILKARGGIFQDAKAKRGISPMALARMLAQHYPEFFRPWQTRVDNLAEDVCHDLLARVPDERISPPGREFAALLVAINRRLLREAL